MPEHFDGFFSEERPPASSRRMQLALLLRALADIVDEGKEEERGNIEDEQPESVRVRPDFIPLGG